MSKTVLPNSTHATKANANALMITQLVLSTSRVRLCVHRENRIPWKGPLLVVSNHRSVMDIFLIMAALQRPVRFACHRYMDHVPVLRDIVRQLGCLPLESPTTDPDNFFQRATHLLTQQEVVGVFPEGVYPMVQWTSPQSVGPFHRGFAHLALRSGVPNLAVLPVAIAPQEEVRHALFPLPLLSFFDPSEPLFRQLAWHPLVLYRHVHLRIGHPYWITPELHTRYHGRQAKTVITELVHYCHSEITTLLEQ